MFITGAKLHKQSLKAGQLLEQLRTQVHTRKDKNVEILSLSADVCTVDSLLYYTVSGVFCKQL